MKQVLHMGEAGVRVRAVLPQRAKKFEGLDRMKDMATWNEGDWIAALAAEQGANPLTVAKAYQQFQADGLVEVQRGVGMYVAAGAADKLRRAERARFLEEEWPELKARIRRLGLDPAELAAEA